MSERETACRWCRRMRLGATWTDRPTRTDTPVSPDPCPRCAGAQRLVDLQASLDSVAGSFSAMAEAARVAASEFERFQVATRPAYRWSRRPAIWATDFATWIARLGDRVLSILEGDAR